jgi:universal stress protein E
MRIDRILLGTDFSENSLVAARWAAQHLAPPLSADVILAHAVDLPQPPAFLRRMLPASNDEVRTAALAEATARLHEVAATLGGASVQVEARSGVSHQVLADMARDTAADLIVVGEHGTRHRSGHLLGTTAERLLACAPCPVLIARDLPAAAPASILAPVDGSPTDLRVLAFGRLAHEQLGSRVTAGHAVDVMELYRRVRTISAAAHVRELEERSRSEAIAWVRGRLREAGLPDNDDVVDVRMGDARVAIISMAERAQADLIVMGGRGAGAVSRFVLGSVTSAILNSTAYAVLVVVGEDRD